MGPAALPVLAVTVGECDRSLSSDECWDGGPCEEYHGLVRDAFKYHAAIYDSKPAQSYEVRDCSLHGIPQPYGELKEFLKANMTEEAWKFFTLLEDNRLQRRENIHAAMDGSLWECSQERHGVCIFTWDKETHKAASACYLEQKQKASQGGYEGTAAQSSFDTPKFAEADIGDLITHISNDVSDGRYVTRLVLRTNQYGWFLRSALRLLERRPLEDCIGPCYETPTFKYDGCRFPMPKSPRRRKSRKSHC